jgi:hypothetical protein
LTSKVIACVKYKGKNLATLNSSLLDIVSCGVLQLERPYSGVYFGHVMSKMCHYAINENVVCQNVKEAQTTLQKVITWTKKLNQGRQEWEATCCEAGLFPQKLKTPIKIKFASKVFFSRNVGIHPHHHTLL